jgi:hypothetical protein
MTVKAQLTTDAAFLNFLRTEDCDNGEEKTKTMRLFRRQSAMASTSMGFPSQAHSLERCSPKVSQSGKNFLLGGENSPDAEPSAD